MHQSLGAQSLTVTLFGTVVGSLTWLPTQKIIFAFAQDYLEDKERPTLSLSYKGNVNGIQTNIRPSNIRLPAFFSNLLPEGKLRSYLSRKANVNEAQEFFLLAALAEDLPGAVRLRSLNLLKPLTDQSFSNDHEGPLRFSLAGVQLKLSGDLTNEKVIIPATGAGGHFIVKLPVPTLPRVNELEYSMLTFAKHVGIDVPEVQLIPVSNIQGIPSGLLEIFVDDCLVSRRFDRQRAGERIHSEDFCQVFAQYDKYNPQFNYQTIASVIWSQSGLQDLIEFVRRLVFTIAIGNADMHLKNWSLIYPDRRNPRLSPAYDFLPSAPIYAHTYQNLALKLAGENRFNYITIDHFKKMAGIARLPERIVLHTANETAARINEVWAELKSDLPLTTAEQRLIGEFMTRCDLLRADPVTHIISATKITPDTSAIPSIGGAPAVKGVMLAAQPELILDLAESDIAYRTDDDRQFILPAPRRMITALLMEQLQTLLNQHPELNMKRVTPGVGLRLFFEWHEENLPQIDARFLKNGLAAEDLMKSTLTVAGTLSQKTFARVNGMHELHQLGDVDFLLSDGSFWSGYCQIREMELISTLPDGRRFVKIKLAISEPRQLAAPEVVHKYKQ